ncbi:MAG: hypothetical protein JWO67_4506 [Streptosporangiaceae bacterium]|nr:hypothetical protein [Streptosporangiaceae bacterium]
MSSQNDREMAGRAVFGKILFEEIGKLTSAIRKNVEPNLEPGEHVVGVLGDGTRIGKVMLTEAPKTADVTDQDALVQWVLDNRPDEIVPAIRPSYMEFLREQVKKHGHAFDPVSREVIPGIELGQGTPAYKPVPTDEGRELVRSKLSELIAGGLLELPAAEAEAS